MVLGLIKKYLPQFVLDRLRERRRSAAVDRAIELDGKGDFAGAARVYEDFALESLSETTLMSSLYRRYAFEEWLNAKEPQNALRQALEALRLLCDDDGKWIKSDNGENADEVISMVSQLYAAGYPEQASELAAEANKQFEKYGLTVRCAAEPVIRSKFPAVCEQCGGRLPESPFAIAIECPFCHTIIYAE